MQKVNSEEIRNVKIFFSEEDINLMKKKFTHNDVMYVKYLKKAENSQCLALFLGVLGVVGVLLYQFLDIYFAIQNYKIIGIVLGIICVLCIISFMVNSIICGKKASDYAWNSNVIYKSMINDLANLAKCRGNLEYAVNMKENTIYYTCPKCECSSKLIVRNNLPKDGDIVLNIKEYNNGACHGWFAETK